jgi:hypothetical protein
VKALRQQPKLTPPPTQTAAEHYFGPALTRLAAQADAEWRAVINHAWKNRQETLKQTRAELDAIAVKATAGETLTSEETWKRAVATEQHSGPDAAFALYEAMLGDKEYSAAANYNIGRILLAREDASGISFLETAMQKDPSNATEPALLLIHAFKQEQGMDKSEVKAVEERFVAHGQDEEKALVERRRDTVYSGLAKFLPHGLEDTAPLDAIKAAGVTVKYVERMYLVRKEVQYFPDRPLFLLVVEWRSTVSDMVEQKDYNNVANALQKNVTLPGETLLLFFEKDQMIFKKRIQAVEGGVVYQREKPVVA